MFCVDRLRNTIAIPINAYRGSGPSRPLRPIGRETLLSMGPADVRDPREMQDPKAPSRCTALPLSATVTPHPPQLVSQPPAFPDSFLLVVCHLLRINHHTSDLPSLPAVSRPSTPHRRRGLLLTPILSLPSITTSAALHRERQAPPSLASSIAPTDRPQPLPAEDSLASLLVTPDTTTTMTWELTRRRIVRTVNEKFIFGRIVRLPLLSHTS